MQIIKISPRGYCKGVVNAINIAKKTAMEHPNEKIYILGMIVHNKYVTEALNLYNIKTIESKGKTRLELLDLIDEGIVIFTAHGISQQVKDKALSKGLRCVDASCIDVQTTQEKVQEKLQEGYDVIYIGSLNHPEAEAITSISDKVHLITKPTEVDALHLSNPLIYVTNQTTMSFIEIGVIFKRIEEKYPQVYIEEELCSATRLRQQALIKNKDLDLLYVVGDPSSNNSNKLRDIATLHGTKNVRLIETAKEIKLEDLNVETVGITAGASTPTYLTNQVIQVLEKYAKDGILEVPEIELSKIL